jgi:TAP42-like family
MENSEQHPPTSGAEYSASISGSTLEELDARFQKIQKIWLHYDNECNDSIQAYEDTFRELKDIESQVRSQGLISRNETPGEMLPEVLQFFMVPFYIADVVGRIPHSRDHLLNVSYFYFEEYLKLLSHYKVLPEDLKRQWKAFKENPKHKLGREEKIKQFREKKEIEKAIQEISKEDIDKEKRKLLVKTIDLYAYRAVETLPLISQEKELLEFQAEMKKNPSVREKYEAEQKKIDPMKVINIPVRAFEEFQQIYEGRN